MAAVGVISLRQRPRITSCFPFLALWLVAAAGFVAIASFAALFERFPADLWVSHRLQDIDAAPFVRATDWAEDVADAPIFIIIWLAAVIGLFLAARRWEAIILLAAELSRPLGVGLKEIVGRSRPPADLVRFTDQPDSPSFPSGHALGALVLYGFLFYLATILIRVPLVRFLAQVACLYVILFTALERIYAGHHWFSDVYGAFYLGGLCLALLIVAQRRWSPFK